LETTTTTTSTPPSTGYCTRCQNAKPPRCHHCSICITLFSLPSLFLFQFFI
jgi:hypothetical protein